MEHEKAIARLKKRLLKDVADFYRQDHKHWKEPIVHTLHDLHEKNVRAVLFGGTLRSLIISRVLSDKPGRPRDVDIVILDTGIDTLREQFSAIISRETRFGGLQLRRGGWHFDVWPLHDTWAFRHTSIDDPTLDNLPFTTFFNLEAIAVEVWPQPGHQRKIYSGNDQFFDGIINRILDINLEENPFPHLCVVRSLNMLKTLASLNFRISSRLARYISLYGQSMSIDDIEYIQQKHYGCQPISPSTLLKRINFISNKYSRDASAIIEVPFSRQLSLWPEDDLHQ